MPVYNPHASSSAFSVDLNPGCTLEAPGELLQLSMLEPHPRLTECGEGEAGTSEFLKSFPGNFKG